MHRVAFVTVKLLDESLSALRQSCLHKASSQQVLAGSDEYQRRACNSGTFFNSSLASCTLQTATCSERGKQLDCPRALAPLLHVAAPPGLCRARRCLRLPPAKLKNEASCSSCSWQFPRLRLVQASAYANTLRKLRGWGLLAQLLQLVDLGHVFLFVLLLL